MREVIHNSASGANGCFALKGFSHWWKCVWHKEKQGLSMWCCWGVWWCGREKEWLHTDMDQWAAPCSVGHPSLNWTADLKLSISATQHFPHWTIDWPLQMQQTDLYQHLTTYKEQYGSGLVIQIYFNNVTCDTEEVVFLQTVPSVSIANHQRSAQIFKRKPALQTGGVESKDVDVYQEGCIMGSVGSRG